tara:strand:- start:7533 stop:8135 length:603 start_codon:yes stop_codon:yes gene_type:complete
MEKEEILDVLGRWGDTGLLNGLPAWEREELALLYDNVTRVMLSKTDTIDEDTFETLSDVTLPTTRRLFRRVGINFDINKMMDELVKSVVTNIEMLKQPTTKENNPIVDFCVQFADCYEDETIKDKTFTTEQYGERVDKVMDMMRTILLSEDMVSFVDRSEDDWVIKYSETKKSPNQTRVWNQKRAVETLHGILNETNMGQ